MFKFKYQILLTILILSGLFCLACPNTEAALNFSDTQKLRATTATAAGISTSSDLSVIAAVIIQALLGLIGAIFFILFLYGGFKWMTAAGNDQQVDEARKLIISAIIGLAIITSAYIIADFVVSALE